MPDSSVRLQRMTQPLPGSVSVNTADRWIPALDTFAARLAALRHEKKWNIRQAARICGFAPGTWRGWELNGHTPHDLAGVIETIHVRTGVDPVWLNGDNVGCIKKQKRPRARRRKGVSASC